MEGKSFECTNYSYCPDNFVDKETTIGIRSGDLCREIVVFTGFEPILGPLGSNNYTRNAKTVREAF